MRMRHFLLTSVASASLFLTATHLPSAHAQRGMFLNPASQWAVTKVAGNSAAGQSGYCAVAKRYEGNAIMTIARNHGTETSFALDLQKPTFSASQPLSVTLDPGAGEQRDYSVTPASAQAFVVRLGRDEAFFNAIDRTGLLRIEVADNSYVFNISDIQAGQSKLNACLASSVIPAAGNEVVPFPTQIASSSNKEFIADLKSRIQSLESQNGALKSEISSVDREVLVAAPAAVSGGLSKAEVLRVENLRLKAALQTGIVEQQNDKLRILEADNQRLAAELSGQSSMSADVVQLQGRIDALLGENVRLQNEAFRAPDVDVSGLERSIERLETENLSLKTALADGVGQDVSEQLRLRIEQVEGENAALKEKALVDKQAAYDAGEYNVEGLAHQDEVAMLQMEIEDLKLAQNANVADNDVIGGLQIQLSSLRKDNLLLQQDLYEKAQAAPSVFAQNGDIAALDAENKNLKSKIDKSLYAHKMQEMAIAALEQENAAIKVRVSGVSVASTSVDVLSSKLGMLQFKLASSQKKQAVQEQRLAALMGENSALKVAMDESVSDSLILVDAINDVHALKQEIAVKDAKLAVFDGVPERLQTLLVSYREVQAEKAALEGQEDVNQGLAIKLAAAEAKNTIFEGKLNGLQKSVIAMSKLNSEVNGLHQVLTLKENEIAKLNTLRGELEAVLAANESLTAEKSQLAYALEEAEKKSQMQIAQLESENARLEGVRDTVLAQNEVESGVVVAQQEELVSENVELRRTLSSALAKIVSFGDALKGKDESIESVLAQNEALRGQLDLASELIASADSVPDAAPRASVAKMRVKNEEMQAGVILASASASVPVAPKPTSKPRISQKIEPVEKSIAEELADIIPAAGEEDLSDEFAQVAAPVSDVVESPEIVEDAQDFMDRDLNQAQIYEEQLKRGLNNKDIIKASRAEPIEVETLVDDVSIDAVVDSIVAPNELVPLEEVAATATAASVFDVEDAPNENLEIRMSQDPFEGIEQVSEGDAVASVSEDIVPDVSAEDAAPLPVRVKQPKSSPVKVLGESGAAAISRVLQLANVSGVSDVKKVDASGDAYQWRVGGLYGSGEKKKMNSMAEFDGLVKDYLMRTEARCTGDFAIVPENSKESGSMRVDSYEIACIGDGVSSSASLVFYNDGDLFTVIAHETEAVQMEQAMLVRDKVFNSLAGGRDS